MKVNLNYRSIALWKSVSLGTIIATTISLGIIFVGLSQICSSKCQVAYAHNFEPNSLSTFLELAYRADIELSLANSNFPLNVTLALDHGKRAVKLLNDVYRSDDDIVHDSDFIKKYNEAMNSPNGTVHALVVANVVDDVLREYGKAFDLDYDLTNMSNMVMMPVMSKSSPVSSPSFQFLNMTTVAYQISNTTKDNLDTIVNFGHYQSAQQLSKKAYQVFNSQLRPLPASSNNMNIYTALPKLEQSIVSLESLVNKKAEARDLMMLVHGQLHPSLQLAFNLKLRR
jgi:hypothetical protein